MSSRSLGGSLTGIALIDTGQIDALAGRVLDGFGQGRDSRAIISAGGRDVQRQQVAERVDDQVQLGSPGPLAPVPGRPAAALGCRAECAAAVRPMMPC